MSWLRTNNFAGRNSVVWNVLLLVGVIASLAAPQSTAQSLQKGISVELARTSSAEPVPNADKQDALIVTVSDAGELFFGIDPVTTDSLVARLKSRASGTQSIYVEADARAPYASVVKVLDAAHSVGISSVTLLTAQPKATQAGPIRSPEGIEMELSGRPR